jgi:uncharacterized protein YndB with AHSA1/START domain
MSHDGTILDLHTVEFKRLLPGPIELAWDYLTKPELLKTWFADVTLEPRVGGAIEVRFTVSKGNCGNSSAHGIIREFQPPHVISFSWTPRRLQPDGSHRNVDEGDVRFELQERGDKALLTLLHSRLPTQELAAYGGGWHAYLDSLESWISGGGSVEVMEVYRHLHPSYDNKVAAILRSGAA